MKIYLYGLGFLFFMFSCATSTKVEGRKKVQWSRNYGPSKVDVSKAITAAEMMTSFEGKKEKMEFTFKAPIEAVCMTAGCWINVDNGSGEKFMVRFKDHFTIPIDTKIGTVAFMHGTANWDTVSVEMLKHFAEDAGKSKAEIDQITEAKYVLGFEADGIVWQK